MARRFTLVRLALDPHRVIARVAAGSRELASDGLPRTAAERGGRAFYTELMLESGGVPFSHT
jgi:hypothetical protein